MHTTRWDEQKQGQRINPPTNERRKNHGKVVMEMWAWFPSCCPEWTLRSEADCQKSAEYGDPDSSTTSVHMLRLYASVLQKEPEVERCRLTNVGDE